MKACFVASTFVVLTVLRGGSCLAETKLSVFDVAYVYHGALLDAEFREISLTPENIEDIQNSILEALSAERPALEEEDGAKLQPKQPLIKKMTSEVLSESKLSRFERILARNALVQRGIGASPASERDFYAPRFAELRRAANALVNKNEPIDRKALNDVLKGQGVSTDADAVKPLDEKNLYLDECTAQSVPVPPDWPNASWVDRGELKVTFTLCRTVFRV